MCEELGTLLPSELELPYYHFKKKKSTDHDVKKTHKTRYILKGDAMNFTVGKIS